MIRHLPKKIVVIGPESTGKSTLCAQLAEHFGTLWVKEYAREYLLTNGTDYTYEHLTDIAKGQIEHEEKGIQTAIQNEWPLMFIDTDMYVMKVWSEFVFNKCDPWILNTIANRSYDLYLLCNIDLPWVKDELREHPDLDTRKKIYEHYKDIMVNQSIPWVDISGSYEERLKKSIEAVQKILY